MVWVWEGVWYGMGYGMVWDGYKTKLEQKHLALPCIQCGCKTLQAIASFSIFQLL